MEEEKTVNLDYGIVSTDMLNEYETSYQRTANLNYADEIKDVINSVFSDFGVDAIITGHIVGPNIIRFSLNTGKNVSFKSIANLIKEIQIRLGGVAVRLDTTSKGMYDIGLEVEVKQQEAVSFKTLYESLPDVDKYPLAVPLGVKVTREPIWIDLKDAPHILASGTTGSGKSILIHSMITSLIMRNSPNDVRFALFDSKMVEFNRYNDMPHLLCPISRDKDAAYQTLNSVEEEMYDRYTKMTEANCCCLEEYNEYAVNNGLKKLPYIVVVFDEYGDFVDQNPNIAEVTISLAKKARVAGIHLIIGIQNPTVKAVTAPLKANVPVHIALMASSVIDSMVILGEGGAEKLMGKGDMFVQSQLISKLGVTRLQGCFIHRGEIKRVVEFLKEHYPTKYQFDNSNKTQSNKNESVTETYPDSEEENKYQSIKEWAKDKEFVSISLIQRECAIGFNRASRYFIRLQQEGVLSKETTKKGNKVVK